MANNRLYIEDPELAKGFGDGWTPSNTRAELEAFLFNRERACGATEAGGHTRLRLVTECGEAAERAPLLGELRQYLTAAVDGSMSRNNSEELAAELLEKIWPT